MHLYIRLRERFPVTIVPGVSGICGAWGVAEAPMTWGDDALVVLPATLPLDQLTRRLALADAAVIMKIGRNFAARARGARARRAWPSARSMSSARRWRAKPSCRLRDKRDGATPISR